MFLQRFLKRVYAIHALIEALSAGREPSPTLVNQAGLEGMDPATLRLPNKTTVRGSQFRCDNALPEPVMAVGGAAALAPDVRFAPMSGLFRAVSF